jgi:hypothetical protein
MYTQFTAAGILTEILNDNAIAATIDTISAVRDRFVASVRRHVSDHGSFAEIPGAKAFVESLNLSPTHRVAYATGGWRGSALLKLSVSGFPIGYVRRPFREAGNNASCPATTQWCLCQHYLLWRRTLGCRKGAWLAICSRWKKAQWSNQI